MAHILDGPWSVYVAGDDGSGNFDPGRNGTFLLKIGPSGDVDRSASYHDPGNGLPRSELDGTIKPLGIGYRVRLFAHLIVGSTKLKRPFIGGLIAPIDDKFVMGGVLLKDQPDKAPARTAGKKAAAATTGQEEGTWVATKP